MRAQVLGHPGGFAAWRATVLRLKAAALATTLPALLLLTGHANLRPGLFLLLLVAAQARLTARALVLWRSAARRMTGAFAERRALRAVRDLPVVALVGLHLAGHRGDQDVVLITPDGQTVLVLEVKAGRGKLSWDGERVRVGGRYAADKTLQQAIEARDVARQVLIKAGLDVPNIDAAVVIGAPYPLRRKVEEQPQLAHHGGSDVDLVNPARLRAAVVDLCDVAPNPARVKAIRKALIDRDLEFPIK